MLPPRSVTLRRRRSGCTAAILLLVPLSLFIDPAIEARTFLPNPVFSVGHNPFRIVAADFNGDGRLDLAMVGGQVFESFTLGVLFGEGGGQYRYGGTVLDTGIMVSLELYSGDFTLAPALYSGDFNLDGKQDLLVEAGSSGTWRGFVLLGQGNGTFQGNGILLLSGRALMGDSNADGRPDLIVPGGSGTTSQLRVYLGALNGTFAPQTPFPAPSGVDFGKAPIVAGDLNGDRIADVVATSSSGTASVVLLGTAAGGFTVGQTISNPSPYRLAHLADVSGDGVLDYIVQSQDALANLWLRVFRGHGNGTFDAAPSYSYSIGSANAGDATMIDIASGDLDLDGRADMAVLALGGVQLFMGNGAGFSTSPRRSVAQSSQGIAIGDFDGAGGLDLAVSARADSLAFVMARPDGSYVPSPLPEPSPVEVRDVVAADFTGDGRLDIAALHAHVPPCEDLYCPWGEVEVFPALAQGGFGPSTLNQVGIEPQSLLAFDLDGDGRLDLVSSNYMTTDTTSPPPGSLSLLRGRGDGSFDPEVPVGVAPLPTSVAAGDFDGDGDIDLAVAEFRDGNLQILLRTAAGTYAPQPPFGAGRGALRVAATDLDRDGKLDLAFVSQGHYETGITGTLAWFRGQGNGAFDAGIVLARPNMGSDLAVADLDADGDPDLVVTDQGNISAECCNGNNGGATVLLNQGQGAFLTASYPAAQIPLRVLIADFNGDGAPDLMTDNATEVFTIFPGLGGGAFGTPARFSQLGCRVHAPTHLVGDGDTDLLAACDGVFPIENEGFNPDLRLTDALHLGWSPLPLVGAYDTIQGSLLILRSAHGDFRPAVLACLQNNGTSPSVDLGTNPPVGSGYFYLVRPVWPNGTSGSYDGEMPGQAAPRDASIAASALACP